MHHVHLNWASAFSAGVLSMAANRTYNSRTKHTHHSVLFFRQGADQTAQDSISPQGKPGEARSYISYSSTSFLRLGLMFVPVLPKRYPFSRIVILFHASRAISCFFISRHYSSTFTPRTPRSLSLFARPQNTTYSDPLLPSNPYRTSQQGTMAPIKFSYFEFVSVGCGPCSCVFLSCHSTSPTSTSGGGARTAFPMLRELTPPCLSVWLSSLQEALGEPIRLALAQSGVEWEDIRVPSADWPALKPSECD